MKNLGTINWNKAFYSVAFVALSLITVLPSSAKAADKGKNQPPVEVKYVGDLNDKPVFQIRLDNPGSENLYLTLSDENGNIIYTDVVRDKEYVKNIQLDNIEDGGVFKLNLILRSKKNYETETFEINRNVRLTENVEVTKVK